MYLSKRKCWHSNNGKESTVNRALGDSTYPGEKLVHFSLCKIFLVVMKHSNLYLGLVLPSAGWQSLIVYIFLVLKLCVCVCVDAQSQHIFKLGCLLPFWWFCPVLQYWAYSYHLILRPPSTSARPKRCSRRPRSSAGPTSGASTTSWCQLHKTFFFVTYEWDKDRIHKRFIFHN